MNNDDITHEQLIKMAHHSLALFQQREGRLCPREFVAQSHLRAALRVLHPDHPVPRVGEFNIDSGTETLEGYFYGNHHGQTRDASEVFIEKRRDYVCPADGGNRPGAEGYPIKDKLYYLGEEPEESRNNG